jgi:hypothetical protein
MGFIHKPACRVDDTHLGEETCEYTVSPVLPMDRLGSFHKRQVSGGLQICEPVQPCSL